MEGVRDWREVRQRQRPLVTSKQGDTTMKLTKADIKQKRAELEMHRQARRGGGVASRGGERLPPRGPRGSCPGGCEAHARGGKRLLPPGLGDPRPQG